MLENTYYETLSLIRPEHMKILQLRDTEFYHIDVIATMSKLRNNPHDAGSIDKEHDDMMIVWTGACGLLIASAEDRRFPHVPWDEYDCILTMTQLKKQRGILSVLERKRVVRKVPLSLGASLHIWESPFGIRAVTNQDTLYGDRWYWDHGKLLRVEEGNKYGDTSLFCMFALVEDRFNRYRRTLR